AQALSRRPFVASPGTLPQVGLPTLTGTEVSGNGCILQPPVPLYLHGYPAHPERPRRALRTSQGERRGQAPLAQRSGGRPAQGSLVESQALSGRAVGTLASAAFLRGPASQRSR